MRKQQGFTLIELMVAIAIMSTVLMFVFQSFVNQVNTHEVIDNTMEAQMSSFLASQIMERDIRSAGFMVPEHAVVCAQDNTGGTPDILYLADSQAIQVAASPSVELLSGQLGIEIDKNPTVGEAAYVQGSSVQTIPLKSLSLDGTAYYSNIDSNDVAGNSDFQFDKDVGMAGGVIIARATGGSAARRAVACGKISEFDLNAKTIQVALDAVDGPPVMVTNIVVIPAIVYEVVNGNLLRNGLVMARDVEDFQVAFIYDLDYDGEVDTGEVLGATTGNLFDSDSAVHVGDDLRELRVGVVVRTHRQDRTADTSLGGTGRYTPETLENSVPTDLTPDGYRRRRFQTSVRLRNVGGTERGS